MQKLTPHTADGFREDVGEQLLLRRYDVMDADRFCDYDLCASAAWVDFRFDGACYYGDAADCAAAPDHPADDGRDHHHPDRHAVFHQFPLHIGADERQHGGGLQ